MAVQKSKKSRAKRDSRRAHDSLRAPTLRVDPVSGERHRAHHLTADGFMRGEHLVQRKVKTKKQDADTGDSEG